MPGPKLARLAVLLMALGCGEAAAQAGAGMEPGVAACVERRLREQPASASLIYPYARQFCERFWAGSRTRTLRDEAIEWARFSQAMRSPAPSSSAPGSAGGVDPVTAAPPRNAVVTAPAPPPAPAALPVPVAAAPAPAGGPVTTAPAPAGGPVTTGVVAWNTPPDMAMKATAEVEVRVTLDRESFATLESRITASGVTRSAVAELTRTLSATLSSTAFDITPNVAVTQTVRKGRDAVWKWVIAPKAPGVHQILLTIAAIGDEGQVVEPLTRTITVVAAPDATTEATVGFLARNWEKLLTVVLIPGAYWAWGVWRRRRAAAAEPPLPPIVH